YFALFGDPLMEDDIDPFPDEYLKRLSRLGVTGVWLQGILRNLATSEVFPEFGEGADKRLESLRDLVTRAGEQGLKIYLYLNEPRAMPESFFQHFPELKGVSEPTEPGHYALCTSQPRVRQWLRESLSQIFSRVPGLGGIFVITMSEHLTNCFSKGKATTCPRCSKRQGWEVVAEVLQTLRDGVREVSADAEVIAWDWGWGDDWVPNGADPEKVIRQLPQDVKLQSVSEWHVPVTRGGFSTRVGEYSISAVGPGPRARRHWTAARQNGLKTTAKVQINATWEISAVPYIPVPHLITRHLDNLLKEGIDGIMLSWTVGGYPSPNLEVAREYLYWPAPEAKEVLARVARRRYGRSAAPHVVQAWKQFSDAFEEFPYGVSMYTIPTQHGPANLLRLQETGYPPGMILFPYDQVEQWVGPYPPEIVHGQFEKMSALWAQGLKMFADALKVVSPSKRDNAILDYGIAETCYLHFKSVANQVRFYLLKASGINGDRSMREELARIARDEIELARRLFVIARRDSRIGFEAANHYYYRPLDLAEKILNCRHILRELEA
ncbi:MAG TPA: alpha-amylase family protein, partial [Acidobacteriota bacterium]|nr:alpha-amylase family protein [Acidobacteriota bacterium]